jgi:hypothetical protein
LTVWVLGAELLDIMGVLSSICVSLKTNFPLKNPFLLHEKWLDFELRLKILSAIYFF